MKSLKANGKLLISGEYLILKGANGFAIPTSYGQSLTFEKSEKMATLMHTQKIDLNLKSKKKVYVYQEEITKQSKASINVSH